MTHISRAKVYGLVLLLPSSLAADHLRSPSTNPIVNSVLKMAYKRSVLPSAIVTIVCCFSRKAGRKLMLEKYDNYIRSVTFLYKDNCFQLSSRSLDLI